MTLKESQLLSQIKTIRNDQELNTSQIYKQQEHELETQNQKISDLEIRANETEIKRSNLVLDFERERASWVNDKEKRKNKTNELKRKIVEHVEHIESLAEEGEK